MMNPSSKHNQGDSRRFVSALLSLLEIWFTSVGHSQYSKDQQFDQSPADESDDRCDLEDRTRPGRKPFQGKDASEWIDESISDVQNPGDNSVRAIGIEKEKTNAQQNERLENPEQEAYDPP